MAPVNQTPQENIDFEEVLREYGLDNIAETNTVVQQTAENLIVGRDLNLSDSDVAAELIPPAIEVGTVQTEVHDNPINLSAQETVAISTSASYPMNGEPLIAEATIAEHVERPDSLSIESVSDIIAATTPIPNNNAETNVADSQDNNEEESSHIASIEEALDLLTPNSKSYDVDESTSRFSGAEWYAEVQKSSVILAGLGGIGSWVFMMLSRMKPEQILLYDDDTVEEANLSGQLYSQSMIGEYKVNAMATMAMDYSLYYNATTIPQKFKIDTPGGDIMICGFDNMEARKTFFNVWLNRINKHSNPEKCLYIDGRLNLEEFQVFCLRGDDTYNIKKYAQEYLFEDWKAQAEECSRKQTTYCSNMIGSVICNLYTNFIYNTMNPMIERELPFKTYYSAEMMYFKTEA